MGIWHGHCGTYKEATAATVAYKKAFKKKKGLKLKLKLSGVTRKVPPAKAKPAKSLHKAVMRTDLKCDAHLLWRQWQTARDKYMAANVGSLVSVQRKELKATLKELMTGYRTHTAAFIKNKGLESLQKAL